MPAERSAAQKEAERRYRESRTQVLVRFSPEEIKLIDAAAGKHRATWIKAKALAAAKARRTR